MAVKGLSKVKSVLKSIIQSVCEQKHAFVKNPKSDFSRERKLPLRKMLEFLLCIEGRTISNELLNYFRCSLETASSSAFVQQRSKLNSLLFPYIFNTFVQKTDKNITYKEYRLLAADGSDIHVPTDPTDTDSYFPGTNGQSPYNLQHLDALYDILQETYLDAEVAGKKVSSETSTLCKMVDRSFIQHALLLADRGYESFNLMAHIQEKGWKFLIRAKDIHSNGIASALTLPKTATFDISLSLSLTNKQSNEIKALFKERNTYKFIPKTALFDYLPSSSRKNDMPCFYTILFRVVRLELSEGKFEVILTNLDAEEFPPLELKKLYAMRWGIETSFRNLKYTLGLLHFHTKKVEYIHQEIFARLIMYNFCRLVTSEISIPDKQRKCEYKTDFHAAVQICRQFFLGNISPPVLEAMICRNLSPIRPGRSRVRKQISRHAVRSTYRLA